MGGPIAQPGRLVHRARSVTIVLAQWPSAFAFVLSFVTVGIMWANHHIAFSYFARTDRARVMLR